MSPNVPIFFALLLALISGSTGSERKMNSVELLRQTLKYWWKVYNTYQDEVALGYCWADHLLQISAELSNPFASPSATGDRPNTAVEATKSQEKPFPENVMGNAKQLEVTPGEEHLRQKRSSATAGSAVARFMSDLNGHRIASEWKVTQRQEEPLTNRTHRNNTANNAGRIMDEDESVPPGSNFHVGKMRRRELSIVQEVPYEKQELAHECSSHGTSSRAVNPTLNPKDDDKVDSGFSRDLAGVAGRKVLRLVTGHRVSFAKEDAFGPRSFSLRVSRGESRKPPHGCRFPFQRERLPSRRRNEKVSELLFELLLGNRGTERDPVGRGVPLNNDGSLSTSRLQFQRVNVSSERGRMAVVKLMDSEGNSSRDSAKAINSRTFRQKTEELSRDSLLSLRGGAVAERSSLESQESGREAVKKNRPGFEAGGNDTRERRYRQLGEEKGSLGGRNVLPARQAIHAGKRKDDFLSDLERPRQQISYENGIPSTESKRRAENALSSVRIRRSAEDYGPGENQNSSVYYSSSPGSQDQGHLSHMMSGIFSVIQGILRTLGSFVQVGRRIMDIVDSNRLVVCTRTYLARKTINWIMT